MSLKTTLYLMASMLGFAASGKGGKAPTFKVEGHNDHPVYHREFSGHRFVRTYPTMNKANTERKAKHRKLIEDCARVGICWTPFGLYRMNR